MRFSRALFVPGIWWEWQWWSRSGWNFFSSWVTEQIEKADESQQSRGCFSSVVVVFPRVRGVIWGNFPNWAFMPIIMLVFSKFWLEDADLRTHLSSIYVWIHEVYPRCGLLAVKHKPHIFTILTKTRQWGDQIPFPYFINVVFAEGIACQMYIVNVDKLFFVYTGFSKY